MLIKWDQEDKISIYGDKIMTIIIIEGQVKILTKDLVKQWNLIVWEEGEVRSEERGKW